MPEYRHLIDKAPKIMSLWIDLEVEFKKTYLDAKKNGELNDDLVGRFYKYARWCLKTAEKANTATDASSAVCCAFFEHIILSKEIRDDMHRWIGPSTLEALSGVFTYHYPAAEFAVFRGEFMEKFKQFTLRSSRHHFL